jgi:hypothetical protein
MQLVRKFSLHRGQVILQALAINGWSGDWVYERCGLMFVVHVVVCIDRSPFGLSPGALSCRGDDEAQPRTSRGRANQNPRGSVADTGHLNALAAALDDGSTCSAVTWYGRRTSRCSNEIRRTKSRGISPTRTPKLQRVCVIEDDSHSTTSLRLYNTEVLAHLYAR